MIAIILLYVFFDIKPFLSIVVNFSFPPSLFYFSSWGICCSFNFNCFCGFSNSLSSPALKCLHQHLSTSRTTPLLKKKNLHENKSISLQTTGFYFEFNQIFACPFGLIGSYIKGHPWWHQKREYKPIQLIAISPIRAVIVKCLPVSFDL